jgi:dihydropyrimidinase
MAVTWFSDKVKEQMKEVYKENGISSFKTFMAYTGAIGVDDQELIEVLDTAKELGALVTVHCEHGLAVQKLQKKLVAQGKTGPRFHAESRPSWIEGEATNRAIVLAKCANEPIYVVHLTCKEALDAVYRARAEGQRVFVETCPQYLLLDDSVYSNEDFATAAQYVMSPPIRPKGHQDALWAALASGVIHTVATDHCPFRTDQKVAGKGDFTKIPNGAAGIQDRLALMYTYGVLTGKITLEQFVDVCATRPAKIFNLYPRKGAVRVGADADLVLFDPKKSGRISGKTHLHKLDKSIFEGFETKGAVTHTVVAGKVAYKDGELRVTRGAGRYLKRT